MKCPACHAVLITVEYQSIELDCCVACGGTWLDAGELELLTGNTPASLLDSGGGGAPQSTPSARKCPICTKRMRTLCTLAEPPVAYERCGTHGIWLDKGELEQVVAKGAIAPGGQPVDVFLRDVFGGRYGAE